MKKLLCTLLAAALLASFACAENLLNEYDMVARIKTQDGLYLVQKDGLWGIADESGTMVVEAQFDSVGTFEDGTAVVKKDGKWGIIADTGALLLEPKLRNEPKFVNGYAVAIVEDKGTPIDSFSGDAYDYDSGFGLINRKGEFVIDAVYELVELDDVGETAMVKDNGLFGYMDMTGTWIVEPKYARANALMDGHAAVGLINQELDSKNVSDPNYVLWGVIDAAGKELIPCAYTWIESGKGDLVIACDNNEFIYGYMNLSGEWVMKPQFSAAELFKDGVAIVAKSMPTVGKSDSDDSEPNRYYLNGVINEAGEEVLPLEFYSVIRKDDGTFVCEEGDGSVKKYKIEDGKATLVE